MKKKRSHLTTLWLTRTAFSKNYFGLKRNRFLSDSFRQILKSDSSQMLMSIWHTSKIFLKKKKKTKMVLDKTTSEFNKTEVEVTHNFFFFNWGECIRLNSTAFRESEYRQKSNSQIEIDLTHFDNFYSDGLQTKSASCILLRAAMCFDSYRQLSLEQFLTKILDVFSNV